MEKLDESDGNGHCNENNINHFAPLHEPEKKGGNKHRTKTNTPIIVIRKKEKGRKDKGDKKRSTNKMKVTWKRRQRQRCMNLIVTMN